MRPCYLHKTYITNLSYFICHTVCSHIKIGAEKYTFSIVEYVSFPFCIDEDFVVLCQIYIIHDHGVSSKIWRKGVEKTSVNNQSVGVIALAIMLTS